MNRQALDAMYELLEASRALVDNKPPLPGGVLDRLEAAVEKIDNLIGEKQEPV